MTTVTDETTSIITAIPLNKLVKSPLNVRRTGCKALDGLTASIMAHGLIQNLTVTPQLDDNGKETNRYQVVAGGRRLAALQALAKQKMIAKTYAIPCQIVASTDASELSLAENIVRTDMHPADQFEAFKAMVDQGQGVETIAARFGVGVDVVRRRLKLANVSPKLFALYRGDKMTLDQLMAFTITDDHDLQEQVWSDEYNRNPGTLRRALTRSYVGSNDPCARFIGEEDYVAAGGTVIRDLFSTDETCFFADSILLTRLVTERLEREAVSLGNEGWAWVDLVPQHLTYEVRSRYSMAAPELRDLTGEEEALRSEYCDAYDALAADIGQEDEVAPEAEERLQQLEAAIQAFDEDRQYWPDAIKAHAGLVIGLGPDGEISLLRGMVRAEDRAAFKQPVTADRQGKPSGPKPLPASLIEEMSIYRTLALQDRLASDPGIALTALLQAMVPQVLGNFFVPSTCLELKVSRPDFGKAGANVQGAFFERAYQAQEEWIGQLSASDDLFATLHALSQDEKLALLAFCVSRMVYAVEAKHKPVEHDRLNASQSLATALKLDMADYWTATKDSYFGKVSKPFIFEAVKEAVTKSAAENLAMMKKDAMAAEAERRMAGLRWLPDYLRPKAGDHFALEVEANASSTDMSAAA